MPGPWEKYSNTNQQASGPWSKFKKKDQEESGLWEDIKEGAISGLRTVGETFDKYTGAPTRSAISSLQEDLDLSKAGRAFKQQFGEDPNLAPTGREIVKRAGVPDTALSQVLPDLYNETGEGWRLQKGGILDPTASGVAGFGMDLAADPTNFIPVGAIAKSATKGVRGALKGVKGASKTASKIGEKGITSLTKKVGSVMTGVPEKEIETYIRHYPEVEKLIEKHGDNILDAADEIRQGFNGRIASTRMSLGKKIGDTLENLPKDRIVPTKPVLDELRSVRGKLNKSLRLEEVKEIDDLIKRVSSLSSDGKVSAKEMFDIKEFLSETAKPSYLKNGQMFVPGTQAQRAAKQASRTARKLVNDAAPTIAESNNTLAKLHSIEGTINKNLISPGKSESALVTAGNATNARNVKSLKQLGEITGDNFLGEAEKFAAASRFNKPGLSAADTTGKGVERQIKALLGGYAVGGPVAAAVAAGATSPLALKLAIKTGRIPKMAVESVLGKGFEITDATFGAFQKALETKAGQRAFSAALRGARAESVGKGRDAWVFNGYQKMMESNPEFIQKYGHSILQSEEGRSLLMKASTAKTQKDLKKYEDQLLKKWGKSK